MSMAQKTNLVQKEEFKRNHWVQYRDSG
uniref:Uncharacterized protein n=1 Tax=Arundo donax TaxID=35708 RepID=A0A0A9GLT7_ARUDO